MPTPEPAADLSPARDGLSPLCHSILSARAGQTYARLVLPSMATPPEAEQLLGKVMSEQLLESPISRPSEAEAMLAGLWLWHDALDRSHMISQSIETETGSFWHEVLH
jgi:hypothetical protein